jgi:hypothetical protein
MHAFFPLEFLYSTDNRPQIRCDLHQKTQAGAGEYFQDFSSFHILVEDEHVLFQYQRLTLQSVPVARTAGIGWARSSKMVATSPAIFSTRLRALWLSFWPGLT